MSNKRQVAKVLTSLGRNLLELNEIDKAVGYLNQSLEITIELNAPFEKLENYRNLTYAYTLLHDFKAADSLQDLFAETSAALYSSDSVSNINADNKAITRKTISSDSTSGYLTVLVLIAILILLSVLAYRK